MTQKRMMVLAAQTSVGTRFRYPRYYIERRPFALGQYRVFAPDGQLVFFCHREILRLQTHIVVYTDETKQNAVLNLQARQAFVFYYIGAVTFDVTDLVTGENVGVLRREADTSRDTWTILNENGDTIGTIIEDSQKNANLRRALLGALLPQRFDLFATDPDTCATEPKTPAHPVAQFSQRLKIFGFGMDIDFGSLDEAWPQFDRRLGIAAAVLLAAVEGRQNPG